MSASFGRAAELTPVQEIADLERPAGEKAAQALEKCWAARLLDQLDPAATAAQPCLVLRPQAVTARDQGHEIDLVASGVEEFQEMGDGKLVTAAHRQGRSAVEEQDAQGSRCRRQPHRPRHTIEALELLDQTAAPSRLMSNKGVPGGRQASAAGSGLPRITSRADAAAAATSVVIREASSS